MINIIDSIVNLDSVFATLLWRPLDFFVYSVISYIFICDPRDTHARM